MDWFPASTPQKKSSEILNRLIALARKHHVIDGFSLRKAKREAAKLVPVDAAAAHLVLGVIACLEGDIDEMHRRHRLAIELSPHRLHAISQYAVSLSRLSIFDEAINQMKLIVELAPEQMQALGMLIVMCYRAGRLRAAEHWLTVWHQRFPSVQHEQEQLIAQTLQFAQSHDISDDALAKSVSEAVNLVVERKVPQGYWEGGLTADDESQWIAYRLRLVASPQEVAELCELLAERFAEMELDPAVSMHYSVGYGIETSEVYDGGNA